MSGTFPSNAFRRIRIVSIPKGTFSSGSGTTRSSTSAWPRICLPRIGPFPSWNSRGTPIASTGTRMSEKRIAASTPSRSIGWIVTPAPRSGVLPILGETFFSPVLLVFREVSPRLPHDPDGSHVDRLAPARSQESVLRHLHLSKERDVLNLFNTKSEMRSTRSGQEEVTRIPGTSLAVQKVQERPFAFPLRVTCP